ncbi:tetratricopeptide repeat protein [Sphingomonas sp.]|uniref:tetratricopeptide repeat protein n=1 Tax=Sphingomonas sp. TaxID=28214 RepID=UPI001ED77312|nr:tetratricopeptide repeat protein [Sphingomonas sp.]MBX3595631.1 tetratricopeptide repeat protein [Sphingomonas sp.]
MRRIFTRMAWAAMVGLAAPAIAQGKAPAPAREVREATAAFIDRCRIDATLMRQCAMQLTDAAAKLIGQDRFADAEYVARAGLALVQREADPKPYDLEGLHRVLGRALNEGGAFEEAEREFGTVVTFSRGSAVRSTYARDLMELASARINLGRLEDAETVLREARAVLIGDRSWQDHPDISAATYRLALTVYQQARYEEAETLFRDVVAMRERAAPRVGNDYGWAIAQGYQGIAMALVQQARLGEAETLTRRAVAILEADADQSHMVELASAYHNLAETIARQGRDEEAEPIFRKAMATGIRAYGTDHPWVAQTATALAQTLRRLDRMDAAEALQRDALRTLERRLGPAHPDVADALIGLASILHGEGRGADALPLVRRARDILIVATGADHPRTLAARGGFAGLLRDQARLAEAIAEYRRVQAGIAARLDGYRIFTPDAFAELRRYRPVMTGHVRAAWALAQAQAEKDPR